MRKKPSRFEYNGEPKTRDLNTEFVATTGLGADMCYALCFGCIDDAGIEEVLEMHLEAVSAASRSTSYTWRPLVRRILKSDRGHTIAIVSIPSSFSPSVRSICT